jgi:hypothetical protein
MQLSILLPTHRNSLLACSRIAQVCALASPHVEVIIRDNSGDPKKREILNLFRREHCNIVLAEPCDQIVNFTELLRLANGEFVFFLSDDDFCFDYGVQGLSAAIKQYIDDPSVMGITGAYISETSKGSSILTYERVDSDDPATRLSGYLSYRGFNVLYYSAVRRDAVRRIYALLHAMPNFFSFHDQIVCLLYLLNGKFVRLNRLLYLYDAGEWETSEASEQRDAGFYARSGFDPAVNALHWFLCGLEGAILVRNADVLPDYPLPQRQAIADLWFSVMFQRFQNQVRQTFGSAHAAETDKLRAKLLLTAGRVLFQDQLAEIRDFLALFSKDGAQNYYGFWDGVLNRRKPGPVAGPQTQPARLAERKAG